MVNIYFHTVDTRTMDVLRALRDLRSKNIKLWFNKNDNKGAIGYIKDKNLIEHQTVDYELSCFCWDIANIHACPLYDNDGLFHLVSRRTSENTDFVCVDSTECMHNQLVLFQDAAHKADYPKEFIKIPCYNDWENLLGYLYGQNVFSFTLNDINKFDRCCMSVQGATVYKEKSTGYYWYLDNFHKTHYEVFDKTGKKHIGEANLDGKIDFSRADSKKQPIK